MIKLHQTSAGFDLIVSSRVIIRHRINRPAIRIGYGEGKASMRHGNFRIRDSLKYVTNLGRPILEEENTLIFDRLLKMTIEQRDNLAFVCFKALSSDSPFNRIWISLEGNPAERIWGGGIQYSHIQLKGRKVPIWTREQGVGRSHDAITLYANLHNGGGGSWHTSYYPQPNFISSDSWYCHIDGDAYHELDFRRPNRIKLHSWQLPRLCIGVCNSVPEAIDSLSRYLGRQRRLPEWTWNGIILGLQGGNDLLRHKLDRALGAGVAVGGVWAQDWVGKRETSFGRQLFWDWQYNRQHYPDLPKLIAHLLDQNIRFLGYINPFLALEGKLYVEASKAGLCVKTVNGDDLKIVVTTFPAALLDLTNPATRKWIKNIIISNMINIGMSGWMADYGEYLPQEAVLYSGVSALEYHNRYPVDWADINNQAIMESNKQNDVLFFSRAGFSGSSKVTPLFWVGDQLVNWSRHDGLPSAIAAQISGGFGAAANIHADIGGYTGLAWIKRKSELFQRWVEQAVFSPMMRTHEGNRPDNNWQFDTSNETLNHLRRMTSVFCALRPYHIAIQNEYQTTGAPPIRHLAVYYSNQGFENSQYCYCYGPDLFIAPVIKPRRHRWPVHLPYGEWVHLWSNKIYSGGYYVVDAPIGYPPAFWKAGSEWKNLFQSIAKI